MKNVSLFIKSFLFISFALFSVSSFSETLDKKILQQYKTLQIPLLKQKNEKVGYPTNITVVNGTSTGIYVAVPNTRVYEYVLPGNNVHVVNPSVTQYTPIVLNDVYRHAFYSQTICPFGIVAVFGAPSRYHVNYDTSLCV